jgi:hypothetical protein
MWQFFFLTARGARGGPFVHMDDTQGEALAEYGAEGWELVGVTTLSNGWLYLALKRPVNPQVPSPALPDSQYL